MTFYMDQFFYLEKVWLYCRLKLLWLFSLVLVIVIFAACNIVDRFRNINKKMFVSIHLLSGIFIYKERSPNSSVAAAAAKLLQSCPTLCDPIDGSPSVSNVLITQVGMISLPCSKNKNWLYILKSKIFLLSTGVEDFLMVVEIRIEIDTTGGGSGINWEGVNK